MSEPAKTRAFFAAFRLTGNVRKAAKAAGVTPWIHYRRMERDPRYRARVEALLLETEKDAAQQAWEILESEMRTLRARVTDLEYELRQVKKKIRPPRRKKSADTTPADESSVLLDSIARGMAKKPFARLSQEHQNVVRTIADRMRDPHQD